VDGTPASKEVLNLLFSIQLGGGRVAALFRLYDLDVNLLEALQFALRALTNDKLLFIFHKFRI
jgi:hypothetical protein